MVYGNCYNDNDIVFGTLYLLGLLIIIQHVVTRRYHILFTKCKNADVNESPMWKLFDLLDSKSTVFEVKKYILGIILNLTNPPEISDNTEEPNKEYLLLSSNSELRISGTFNFETSG